MSGKPQFARIGPVHFQPLEWELEPVSRYLRGHLLNAGCGDRDIGAYLRKAGVEQLTNYDIASTIAGAVLGPLESMPFSDAQFDSILCNAVLEHVASAEAVVSELVRVLRPGGHAILTVPFLQPFHECPLDFRRYTRDGLVTLGEGAGLKALAVHPVHSAAQTLGWIAWEIALEKKSRLLRWALWPVIYLATRIWIRTDPNILRNANTYQIVFTRP
jgi:SAM-dependent methyltransferase